eukprot:9524487-Ditylum_brightwellii.AAC.1
MQTGWITLLPLVITIASIQCVHSHDISSTNIRYTRDVRASTAAAFATGPSCKATLSRRVMTSKRRFLKGPVSSLGVVAYKESAVVLGDCDEPVPGIPEHGTEEESKVTIEKNATVASNNSDADGIDTSLE